MLNHLYIEYKDKIDYVDIGSNDYDYPNGTYDLTYNNLRVVIHGIKYTIQYRTLSFTTKDKYAVTHNIIKSFYIVDHIELKIDNEYLDDVAKFILSIADPNGYE